MAQAPLSRKDAVATLKAIELCGGNRVEAAATFGLSPSTLKSRLRIIRNAYPDLPLPQDGARGGHSPKEPRTLAEDVSLHRARESDAASRAKLKDALAELNALQERIANLEWADNISLKPAAWVLDARVPKGKSPHIPLLFFSDAQAGEIVRAEETDTPWDYNSEIFRQRYRKMIAVSIDLAKNHGGTRWSYPGFCYLRGGDNISGGLHEDLRELGEDRTVTQQCELVFEEEAAGINKLADAFGRVEVQTPGAAGNHDRTTHKPPSKLAWARSFDSLIHKLLTGEFKRDKRVTFHISRSPDIRFPIFNKKMICSHGDRLGSRGGMGFVGPGATILRGWQRLLMEQAALGYLADMVFTGHFHYPLMLPIGCGNGSFTGTTEYGKGFRLPPQAPLQYLMFFHAQHGLVDSRPLYLA